MRNKAVLVLKVFLINILFGLTVLMLLSTGDTAFLFANILIVVVFLYIIATVMFHK